MNTSWEYEDGSGRITIKDIIKELDKQKVPIKDISISELKPVIIKQDYRGNAKERVDKADLSYPIIVIVKDRKYKSILDGNHRIFKAIENGSKTIKAREIDLDSKDTPQIYKDLFNYKIEPLLEKRKRKYKKRKSSSVKRRRGYGVWGYPWVGGYGFGTGAGTSGGTSGGGDGGGGGGDGG